MRTALPYAIDVIAGMSLAFILQTSYRFSDSVGIGEIGLVVSTVCGIGLGSLSPGQVRAARARKMVLVLILYLLVVLLPTTIIYSGFGTPGASVRDWAAYFLCSAFLYSLVLRRTRLNIVVLTFLVSLLLLLSFHLLFGNDVAWQPTRFTGGARNPNQLALYTVCAIALTSGFIRPLYLRCATAAAFIYLGLQSGSDAFMAYLAAVLCLAASSVTLPSKNLVRAGTVFLLGISILTLLLGPRVIEILDAEWISADEGGIRMSLALNGLRAWLSSPISIIFGNGAGKFSGLSGPFRLAEAHNTPIDLLATGGLVGIAFFYLFPMGIAASLHRQKMNIMFSLFVGLLIFSLFHHIARHPIVWFTIFSVGRLTELHFAERRSNVRHSGLG